MKCSFSCLAPFTQQGVFKAHPCHCVHHIFIPFYDGMTFPCVGIPRSDVSIHQLKGAWVVSTFWLL